MKKYILLTLLFFTLISPINSETKEKKEYGQYAFYSKCLDDALPQRINNGLVWFCSNQAIEKLDVLINSRISSRGKCYENFEKYGSHACVLKKSQDAFEKYVNATCKENKYSLMNPYCEMMLKKDRLKWLDKSL